ncbi:MAG TPA: MbcA/ParS/Xre antitoxin family protein [Alphaproteobacteria bacterium]|nr:MbcA/ParS/Xre antitoxin family protein [Alphaproteobacteria bacterium]
MSFELHRIQIQAELVFEDAEKARTWLRKPLWILDGMTPLAAAQSEHGAELVREMLVNLAWGGAA